MIKENNNQLSLDDNNFRKKFDRLYSRSEILKENYDEINNLKLENKNLNQKIKSVQSQYDRICEKNQGMVNEYNKLEEEHKKLQIKHTNMKKINEQKNKINDENSKQMKINQNNEIFWNNINLNNKKS